MPVLGFLKEKNTEEIRVKNTRESAIKDKLKFFTKLLKSSRGSSMYIYEPKPTFHIVKQNTGHCAYCM